MGTVSVPSAFPATVRILITEQALHHERQSAQTPILAYLISSESRPPNIENTPSRIYGAGYTLLHESQHFNSLFDSGQNRAVDDAAGLMLSVVTLQHEFG